MNKQDTYASAMMLLYMLKDDPRYAAIAQLSYILDRENFLRFIEYFQGTELIVPTKKEIKDALDGILYSRYRKEGYSKRYAIDEISPYAVTNMRVEQKKIEDALNELNFDKEIRW